MSREMDEIYNEGAMEKAKETALILADRGMSVSDIADIVKVDVKLVRQWLSENRSLAK